jgi:hypothetical protein
MISGATRTKAVDGWISTKKNNASTVGSPIEKVDARNKRD